MGAWRRAQHPGLYNLPVVPDGATQHHAEDHPDDLKSTRTIVIVRARRAYCLEVRIRFKKLFVDAHTTATHHNSRHTDPDVTDDVELLVEEVRDCSEAVLENIYHLLTHKNKRQNTAVHAIQQVAMLKTEQYCHRVAIECKCCFSETRARVQAWF